MNSSNIRLFLGVIYDRHDFSRNAILINYISRSLTANKKTHNSDKCGRNCALQDGGTNIHIKAHINALCAADAIPSTEFRHKKRYYSSSSSTAQTPEYFSKYASSLSMILCFFSARSPDPNLLIGGINSSIPVPVVFIPPTLNE